jgi:hypothetical protein
MQYTIRSVPPKVDSALRQQARKTGKSLNEVVLETLEKGAGVKPDARYHDLDWFVGKGGLDNEAFDDAMAWLDSLPNDLEENL